MKANSTRKRTRTHRDAARSTRAPSYDLEALVMSAYASAGADPASSPRVCNLVRRNPKFGARGLGYASDALLDGADAILMMRDETPRILVRRGVDGERLVWAIARALARWLLERRVSARAVERCVDDLAAALLLPQQSLLRLARAGLGLAAIAYQMKVEVSAVRTRVAGLLAPGTVVPLCLLELRRELSPLLARFDAMPAATAAKSARVLDLVAYRRSRRQAGKHHGHA